MPVKAPVMLPNSNEWLQNIRKHYWRCLDMNRIWAASQFLSWSMQDMGQVIRGWVQ